VACITVIILERPWPLGPIPAPKRLPKILTYTTRFDTELQPQARLINKTIAAIYASPKGWQQAGIRFVYTTSRPIFTIDFTTGIHIASLSHSCDDFYNCTVGNMIYINTDRWLYGDNWPGTFVNYHVLIINHETGHILGLDEWGCICALRPAPVMLYHQNTTGWHLWKPNPWPISYEIDVVQKDVK